MKRTTAKRATAGILAAGLMMAALPASAAEGKNEMSLNAEVASTYILTIPQDTEILFRQTSTPLTGVLKVSGNVDAGEMVTVTAQTNPLHNARQNVDLTYTLEDESGVFGSAQWTEEELRAGLTGEGKALTLFIGITEEAWKMAKAGSYEGSIVFQAELK